MRRNSRPEIYFPRDTEPGATTKALDDASKAIERAKRSHEGRQTRNWEEIARILHGRVGEQRKQLASLNALVIQLRAEAHRWRETAERGNG